MLHRCGLYPLSLKGEGENYLSLNASFARLNGLII